MTHRVHTSLWSIFAAALLLWSGACAPGSVAEGVTPVDGCRFDSDCPDSFYCVEGVCRVDGPQCQTSSDCTSDHHCVNGVCEQACQLTGCPTGETCAASGSCSGGSGTGGVDAGHDGGSAGGADAGTHDGGTTGGADAGHDGGSTGGPDAGTTGGPDAGPVCTPDTWTNYSSAAFRNNCSGCHSWATSYSKVASRQYSIAADISSGSMPRGSSLPASDKTRMLKWLNCGLPQ